MEEGGQYEQASRRSVLPVEDSCDCKHSKRRGQVSGINVLVHDVECSPGDGQRNERRDQRHRSPTRLIVGEAMSTQFPAGKQKEKNRSDMPEEQDPLHRQMSNPHRGCDQIRKEGQMRMELKEFWIRRKEPGTYDFFSARKVDLCVLGTGMVAVDEECSHSQRKQDRDLLEFQIRLSAGGHFPKQTCSSPETCC